MCFTSCLYSFHYTTANFILIISYIPLVFKIRHSSKKLFAMCRSSSFCLDSNADLLSWAQSLEIRTIDWAQLSKFHLKMEIQSLKHCVLNKNRMIDNVQKDNFINITSLTNFWNVNVFSWYVTTGPLQIWQFGQSTDIWLSLNMEENR
jgi:hypothetical protein